MYTGLSPRTRSLLGRLTQVANLSAVEAEATYVADRSTPIGCPMLL